MVRVEVRDVYRLQCAAGLEDFSYEPMTVGKRELRVDQNRLPFAVENDRIDVETHMGLTAVEHLEFE